NAVPKGRRKAVGAMIRVRTEDLIMKIGTNIGVAILGAATLGLSLAPSSAQAAVLGGRAPGDTQEDAALLGAIVGSVAGHSLAERGDKTTGAVVGAAAGAAAASAIGCEMQKDAAAGPARPRAIVYKSGPV